LRGAGLLIDDADFGVGDGGVCRIVNIAGEGLSGGGRSN